jgi:hypothetical protein
LWVFLPEWDIRNRTKPLSGIDLGIKVESGDLKKNHWGYITKNKLKNA